MAFPTAKPKKPIANDVRLEFPPAHSDKQRLIYSAFSMPVVREIYICMGTKFGKAQHYKTITPTPDRGFVEFKDIKVGDFVFDEHGKPTKVLYVTDLMYDRDCYKVTFSDGNEVIVDANHDWMTTTHRERKNAARRGEKPTPIKRTTLEIFNTQSVRFGGAQRPNHAVDNLSAPAEFNKKDLPIPPYTLGAWLGDGDSIGGAITNPEDEIAEHIAAEGFKVSSLVYQDACKRWRVEGLTTKLREAGLAGNKHVPSDYLVSSKEDRIALLQGLMDTDGTVDKRGNCCFDNTNKNIVDAVAVLATSMGIKVNRSERIGRLNGVDHKMCYRVFFTTDFPVFRLKRKLGRLKKSVCNKSRRRTIVSVENVGSVPVMCIRVENPSHLYLTTDAFIPTHNTIGASVSMIDAGLKKPGSRWRWVAPIYEQSRIGLEYFKSLLPPEPYTEPNNSRLQIEMPIIDVRWEFKHASKPSSLEGAGIDGYVLDEAARMDRAVRASIRTTMTARPTAKAMYVSYPFGKNWFYEESMKAKEEMEWAIRSGRAPEKLFFHARTIDNPFISAKVVEDARRELPERLFKQYYLAEFVDDGTVFAGYQNCLYGENLDRLFGDNQRWFAPEAKTATVVVGADWAKVQDYTVFTAIDMHTQKMVGYERFHKIPFTEAVRRLVLFCRKFQDTYALLHDKTGVGGAIDDQLAYTGLPSHGVTFTNQLKAEWIAKLITSIEQKYLGLPRIPELIGELDAFEVSTTSSGLLSYSAPSGRHDDIIMSLMLSHMALLQYGDRDMSVAVMETPRNEKQAEEQEKLQAESRSPIELFYNALAGDDDDD